MKLRNKSKLCIVLLFMTCLIFISVSCISATDVEGTTFTDLDNAISKSDNISLTKDIICNTTEASKFTKGIVVSKNLTINGNGHVIDGNNSVRIFNITNSSAVLTLKNITLKNGNATIGGAIYSDNHINIIANDDVSFCNNTAIRGGAIGTNYGVNITATSGGVSFYNNNASIDGGAIYSTYRNVIITATSGGVSFYNHNASSTGGAIYSHDHINIIANDGVNFYNNIATEGGAIYSVSGNVIINATNGNVIMNNNNASSTGGAIYTEDAYVVINATNGNVIMNNNNAGASIGGAIKTNGNVNITAERVIMNNNKANGEEGFGGAIFTIGSVTITTTNGEIIFANNNAVLGGAIFAQTVNITNAIFYGNNATNGTAIAVFDFKNSKLTHNYWGLNYKNQTEIKINNLIAVLNDDLTVNRTESPKNWVLLNLTIPTKIVTEENNTFQSKFNILTDGTHNSTYNNFNGTILVKINSTLTNTISYVIVGKAFNMTFIEEGTYKISMINIYTNQTITESSFKVDSNIKSFKDLQKLIDNNTELVLKNNYTFINSKDSGSLIINKTILIDGNGTTINGNLNTIFYITKNGNLTLKNINLINTNVCIINDGALNINNVKSTGSIINNGIITSGVTFHVYSRPLITTYDSFVVVLKTIDGVLIKSNNLVFCDDQGHTYDDYMYNDDYGSYVCYAPVGVIGHVTFNNVSLSNYPSLVSSGSLDINEYSKTIKKTKSTINKVVKAIQTKVVISPIVKNINHFVKNTIKDLTNNMFKSLNYILRA